jgi:nucleoid-associated protein YgaU
MIVTKEKAAIRRASYDCNVESTLGRIATKRLYHRVSWLVKYFFAVFCIISMFLCVKNVYDARHPQLIEEKYIVRSGDTLWSIAEKHKPDSMVMGDYMAFLYEKNGYGYIYPGDRVTIGVVK